MKTMYITKDGKIEREGSTLYYIGEDFKQHLPAMNLKSLIILAKVSLSSWAIDYFNKLGISVHFLDQEGRYQGSLISGKNMQIGDVTVEQARAYDDSRRLIIAREFVEGIRWNILKNLKYYSDRIDLDTEIEQIMQMSLEDESVEALRGKEGNIWQIYYGTFSKFLKGVDHFERTYYPPKDEINAMISYGNSILYSIVLSSIVISGLNPSISFLHEPSNRSFSLALDISDIFKPTIVISSIAKLVNKNMINGNMFVSKDEGVYLSEIGRREFVRAIRDKLETTLQGKSGRTMTYENIITEECYSLKNFILNGQRYKSFRGI